MDERRATVLAVAAQTPTSSGCSSMERSASGEAGAFRCRRAGAAREGQLRPGRTALVLHTSGTTARPKLVPLTHRRLCLSAEKRRGDARADGRRPLPERHASLPHPRPRRRPAVVALTPARASSARPASTRRLSTPGSRSSSRRGTRRCPRCTRRCVARAGRTATDVAALREVVVGASACSRARRSRAGIRRSGHRGVRHDRGRAPAREQPAATSRAEAGLGWPGDGSRHRRARRDHPLPPGIGEVVVRGETVFDGLRSEP